MFKMIVDRRCVPSGRPVLKGLTKGSASGGQGGDRSHRREKEMARRAGGGMGQGR